MATLTLSYTFGSGTQGWSFVETENYTGHGGFTTTAWGPAGNPGGSLSTWQDPRNLAGAIGYWELYRAWTALGVPAGSTVTAIRVTNVDEEVTEADCTIVLGPHVLTDGHGGSAGTYSDTLVASRTVTADETTWSSRSGSSVSVPAGSQAASSAVSIRLAVDYGDIGTSGGQAYIDNVTIVVTYTPGASSGSAAGSASASGVGAATAAAAGSAGASSSASGVSISGVVSAAGSAAGSASASASGASRAGSAGSAPGEASAGAEGRPAPSIGYAIGDSSAPAVAASAAGAAGAAAGGSSASAVGFASSPLGPGQAVGSAAGDSSTSAASTAVAAATGTAAASSSTVVVSAGAVARLRGTPGCCVCVPPPPPPPPPPPAPCAGFGTSRPPLRVTASCVLDMTPYFWAGTLAGTLQGPGLDGGPCLCTWECSSSPAACFGSPDPPPDAGETAIYSLFFPRNVGVCYLGDGAWFFNLNRGLTPPGPGPSAPCAPLAAAPGTLPINLAFSDSFAVTWFGINGAGFSDTASGSCPTDTPPADWRSVFATWTMRVFDIRAAS